MLSHMKLLFAALLVLAGLVMVVKSGFKSADQWQTQNRGRYSCRGRDRPGWKTGSSGRGRQQRVHSGLFLSKSDDSRMYGPSLQPARRLR